MLVPGSVNPLLLTSAAGAAAGGISRSIRLNAPDSAYLSRTPGSAGNRDLWTLAFWLKRCKLGTAQDVFSVGTSGTDILYFDSSDRLCLDRPGATVLVTTQVFRDPSAWYHIVLRIDSTNGTNANKARLYVNGSEITTFSTDNRSGLTSSSFLTNTAILHTFGIRSSNTSTNPCDIYLADAYMVDGSSLAPSSFTETDATTGQLIPKAFTGSYGTNGFHLEFSDNSGTTSTTLGKDSAGSNNWTPNNFSVSSGAGNDSLVDVPVNGDQTDTGVGGEVRGNYCTLNPLNTYSSITLSNGNLDYSHGSSGGLTVGTIGVSTGKWYWEHVASTSYTLIGLYQSGSLSMGFVGTSGVSLGFTSGGFVATSGGPTYVNSVSYGTSDVIGFALNMDAGTLTIYKNGSATSLVFSGLTGTWFPAEGANSTSSGVFNFGARSFAYTAPSGFKALCTANLPAPLVTKPSTVMDVLTITGANQAYTGLNFSPDFLWFKRRDNIEYHYLFDTIRGGAGLLYSNRTDAEVTGTTYISAFGSNGFTTANGLLANSASYVTWAWDAGSSTDTNNTAGTITPTGVRANATAGFAVITGSTPASNINFTFGHNLGIAPSLVIYKHTAVSGNWQVYHRSGGGNNYNLNSTAGPANSGTWSGLDPTSTLITIPSTIVSANSSAFVCYAFAPVVGYSSFGSWTAAAPPVFVYTGFRPAFVMAKSSTATEPWYIRDNKRSAVGNGNPTQYTLFPNNADAERDDIFDLIDFVSNGFVVRGGSGGFTNNGTMIYAAFAEAPFNYARAR